MLASRTLLVVSILGPSLASADGEVQKLPQSETIMTTGASYSVRGVAQNYLVLPEGGELDTSMKFVTADPLLGGQPLRFSDLALFTLSGRYALFSRLELSAATTLVPKQPSYTSEKPWQSASVTVRTPIGQRAALAIGGSGGHLMDHQGEWTRESMVLEMRKPIEEYLSFDVQGGIDGITLTAPNASSAFLTEVAVQTAAHFRDPYGYVGGWVGIAYAIPVASHGADPTTGLTVDPQPRLDFHIGGALSPVESWDLYVDFAVIDRGDLTNPATRLPILDGGFDQRQLMFGLVHHFKPEKDGHRHHRHDDTESDPMISVR